MIVVEGVTKNYGKIVALANVSLQLSTGEVLAVVGPSGCGKTSLLRLIAGLEQPDGGKILIDGAVASNGSERMAPHKRRLSMIFQELALWPHMTAEKHLEFVLKEQNFSRQQLQEEIKKLLAQVNLTGHARRYPHQLSGGERQRLAIARALAAKPAYLLMDEPFSNLDSILKDDLQDLILKLSATTHMGILYVTHNIEEVHALADRIAVLNQGRLEQIGTKEKVMRSPKSTLIRRVLRIEESASSFGEENG